MSEYGFGELEALRTRLRTLRKGHWISLEEYAASQSGYRHVLSTKPDKASIACSVTAYRSLMQTFPYEEAWCSKLADFAYRLRPFEGDLLRDSSNSRVYKSADLPDNNPFTLGFAVLFLCESQHFLSLNKDKWAKNPSIKTKVESVAKALESQAGTLIGLLLDSLKSDPAAPGGEFNLQRKPGFAQLNNFESAYITHLVLTAIDALTQLKLISGKWLKEVAEATVRVRDRAFSELSEQIVYATRKSKLFDPYQLAYSVVLAVHLTDSKPTGPEHRNLIDQGIDVYFGAQLDDGSWPLSHPLFNYPKLGDAYCFEFECLAALLGEEYLTVPCRRHLAELGKAVGFLANRYIPLPQGGRAWSSEHHRRLQDPESWSTAVAYSFMHLMDRIVAEEMRFRTFQEFGLDYDEPREKSAAEVVRYFEESTKLIDCPLSWRRNKDGTFKAIGHGNSLKKRVVDKILKPLSTELGEIRKGREASLSCNLTHIFYGPPGTSKTQLAKLVADSLGWPLLQLNPSHFLSAGNDKVIAEAERIFALITRLEQVVVFLDEIDEMFRERGGSQEMGSRLITTAMLPKLSEVRDVRKVVFVVATNYIELIDDAIRRQGRFDLKIAVLPPCLEAHRSFINAHGSSGNRASVNMQQLFNVLDQFPDELCSKILVRILPLMTFFERLRVAEQVALVSSVNTDEEKLIIALNQWVRDEFLDGHDQVLTLFRQANQADLEKDDSTYSAFPFRNDISSSASPVGEMFAGDSVIEAIDNGTVDLRWCGRDREDAVKVFPERGSWAHKCMKNESYMKS